MNFTYSKKYFDGEYEYFHAVASQRGSWSSSKLLKPHEWRALGIKPPVETVEGREGDKGDDWEHYMWYKPEPNVFLFRRRGGVPSGLEHPLRLAHPDNIN
jgi:hypothetical protein